MVPVAFAGLEALFAGADAGFVVALEASFFASFTGPDGPKRISRVLIQSCGDSSYLWDERRHRSFRQ